MVATAVKEQDNASSAVMADSIEEVTKRGRKPGSGNKFGKRPTKEMLTNVYVDPDTGDIDELYNRNFVLEQITRNLIQPLELNREDGLALFQEAFTWYEDASTRELQETVRSLLDQFANSPDALKLIKEELLAAEGAETGSKKRK